MLLRYIHAVTVKDICTQANLQYVASKKQNSAHQKHNPTHCIIPQAHSALCGQCHQAEVEAVRRLNEFLDNRR